MSSHPRVAAVDLDDTLIASMEDFSTAIDEFVRFVQSEASGSVSAEAVRERQREIDYALTDVYGLELGRFPRSFELALEDFISEPSREQYAEVRRLGRLAYKEEEEYAERGFLPGAEELLDELEAETDELWLITSGDNRLQERKICALDLGERFDTILIPTYSDGKAWALNRCREVTGASSEEIVHIGNSVSSDIEAAIEAGVDSVHVNGGVGWLDGKNDEELAASALDADVTVYVFDDVVDVIPHVSRVFEPGESGVVSLV